MKEFFKKTFEYLKKIFNYLKKAFNYLKKHTVGLHKTISYVKKVSGNLRMYTFVDIIRCYFSYGANYNEYRIFEFYKFDRKREDTYLTKIRHDNLKRFLFNKKKAHAFVDRREFYKKYDKYLKRNTCYSKNLSFKQVEELINNSKDVVCKSSTLKEENTKVLRLKDFRSAAYLLESSKKSKLNILEEDIKQHKLIEEINPNNMNILSIVTLKYNDIVDVICATMKFGTNKTYEYDYKKSDYICGFVDLKTGKIKNKLRSRNGVIYTKHPITGIKLNNFEIPNFKKAIDTALKCAEDTDEALEVEWNFAIGQNKVMLISANEWSDFTFAQIPDYSNSGLMPYYRTHVNKTKKL